MESFALYLFRSAIWLSGFTLIYLLFLRKERYFTLKRIYLVTGIIISFLFPIVTVHYQVQLPAPPVASAPLILNQETIGQDVAFLMQNSRTKFNLVTLLPLAYIIGIIVLLIRNLRHFRGIIREIRRSEKNNVGSARLIRTSEYPSSFSFFNYVFVNPSVNEDELKEIMNHELVHVSQKHWLDLALAELIRLLQWANPFAWIYTGLIRLNHEYLADEVALQRSSDPAFYRALLLNQIFRSPVISLSNSFNYSITKTRFEMMKAISASPYRKLKVLSILPVIAIILFAFASPEYKYTSVPEPNAEPVYIYETEPVRAIVPGIVDQQEQTVKGIVRDQSGKPVSGAMITSTGTMGNAKGAETNNEGYFEIKNVQKDARLLVNARGYKGQTITPDFKKQMTITLEADAAAAQAPQRPKDPLIVIDGEISGSTMSEARKSLGHNFGYGKMLMGKDATDKYGEKAANGVFEITTRKKAIEMGMNPPYPRIDPEDFPTFQGAKYFAFNEWVGNQVKFPQAAKDQGIEGWVMADFNIMPDGSIGDLRVKGPDILKDEVLRVINSAPKFEPPKNPEANEPLNSNVAIRFKLPDEIIKNGPYVVVENMPMYPGGDAALLQFLRDNTKYPESLKSQKAEGRVIVRFIVTPEGNTEGITVLKGVNPEMDAEAIRVVGLLTGFKPGMQGGNPVYVWYMCPITFTAL